MMIAEMMVQGGFKLWPEGGSEDDKMMCGVGGAQSHNPVWGLRITRVKTKFYIMLCTVPSLLCQPFCI